MNRRRNQRDILRQFKDSFCVVKAFFKEDILKGVWIELVGEISKIPSTSNSRMIRQRRIGQKVVPFLGKNSGHLKRLDIMTKLYEAALLEQKYTRLSFEDSEVFVLAQLSNRPGRWDSHNMAKPIGDWLEDIGLIHNDKQAEIFCIKKKDYQELTLAQKATQIIIQPRAQVKSLTTQYIYEIANASTGFQYIG